MDKCLVCGEGVLSTPMYFRNCNFCGSDIADNDLVKLNHKLSCDEKLLKKLAAWVLANGTHKWDCFFHIGHDCNCGLEELRLEAKKCVQ